MRLTIARLVAVLAEPRRGLVGLPRRDGRRQPAARLRQRRARAAAGGPRHRPDRDRAQPPRPRPHQRPVVGHVRRQLRAARLVGDDHAVRPARRPRRAVRDPGWRSALRLRDLERAIAVREYRTTEPLAVAGATLRFARTRHSAHSYATRIEDAGRMLVYTGDAALTPTLVEHARGADLLLARGDLRAAARDARRHPHDGAADGGPGARRRGRPAGADAPRGGGPGRRRWPPRRPSSRTPTWPCPARDVRHLNELLTSAVPGADAAPASMRLRCRGARTDYHLSDGRAKRPAVSRSRRRKSDAWHPNLSRCARSCAGFGAIRCGSRVVRDGFRVAEAARDVTEDARFVRGRACRRARGRGGSRGCRAGARGPSAPARPPSASATFWTASRSR